MYMYFEGDKQEWFDISRFTYYGVSYVSRFMTLFSIFVYIVNYDNTRNAIAMLSYILKGIFGNPEDHNA